MKRIAVSIVAIGFLFGLMAQTPSPTVAKARAATMRAEIERLEARAAELKEQLVKLEEIAGTQAETAKAEAKPVVKVRDLRESHDHELIPEAELAGAPVALIPGHAFDEFVLGKEL